MSAAVTSGRFDGSDGSFEDLHGLRLLSPRRGGRERASTRNLLRWLAGKLHDSKICFPIVYGDCPWFFMLVFGSTSQNLSLPRPWWCGDAHLSALRVFDSAWSQGWGNQLWQKSCHFQCACRPTSYIVTMIYIQNQRASYSGEQILVLCLTLSFSMFFSFLPQNK